MTSPPLSPVLQIPSPTVGDGEAGEKNFHSSCLASEGGVCFVPEPFLGVFLCFTDPHSNLVQNVAIEWDVLEAYSSLTLK